MSHLEAASLKASEFGIGIIGVGGIAYNAHLPAYANAGLKVVAAVDSNPEALAKAKSEWGIEKVFTDYRDLLALPEVRIVDVATPPMVKLPQVLDAARAGKHLLVQKPFSRSFEEAKAMVAAAEQAGVLLAINQQARWIPALLPVKDWIEGGCIGEPYFCLVTLRGYVDMRVGTWKTDLDPFLIIQNTVHYLDLVRHWLGDPKLVYAIATKDKTQHIRGENLAVISLEFDGPLRACVFNDWCYRGGGQNSEICIEGTAGAITGAIHAQSITLRSGTPVAPEITEYTTNKQWFPDAFAGPMLELMAAIAEDREPRTSGRDNLKTMQVVFAAYKSISEKRAVAPKEIGAKGTAE
ncbi:MAG: Gfo/Idh/MocA family oxidoreductase [Kiritimatiellaeota bacterium]|nr:Gfo/Idh/MocA family oxidoreductase [Kiritimatiellota bacterium]